MKILIVDDHTLFRESLCLVLARMYEQAPTLLQAGDSSEAMGIVRQHEDISLILMDIDMPGISGLESVRTLKKLMPDIPVVMISANEDHSSIREALDAGAKGFVPKNTSTEVMLSALKLVLAGGIYLPAQLLAQPYVNMEVSSVTGQLTPRQMEILKYLQRGVQNKIIAHELNLSESTVKVHVRRIFTALGAKNRSQAVNRALEMKIL